MRSRLVLSIALSLFLFGGKALAYEEPKYNVIHSAEGYEVREYAERVAAQVIQSTNQNNAFGLLFRYISGANLSSEKVSMTVPVARSEKIQMTVPVAQSSAPEGGYMQFFLPGSYTMDSAPQPTDPNVQIVSVNGGNFAVRKFSGRASASNFEREKSKLLDRLIGDGITISSEVVKATYNGPFTPPFLRRNEVIVEIEWPKFP